jgi:XTP/dITP diphosphohydrolase
VFGDETADSASHVESVWLARKTAEKSRDSVLDGIPAGLPALLLAAKMRYRATHGGVAAEVTDAATRAVAERMLDEVGTDRAGELLLALAVAALDRGVDPESALRGALRDYAATVRAAEAGAAR